MITLQELEIERSCPSFARCKQVSALIANSLPKPLLEGWVSCPPKLRMPLGCRWWRGIGLASIFLGPAGLLQGSIAAASSRTEEAHPNQVAIIPWVLGFICSPHLIVQKPLPVAVAPFTEPSLIQDDWHFQPRLAMSQS